MILRIRSAFFKRLNFMNNVKIKKYIFLYVYNIFLLKIQNTIFFICLYNIFFLSYE